MGLLDDYQNLGDESGENSPDAVQDIRKKRADLERSIVIAESDLKKILREKTDVELGRRKIKKEAERIRVERDALDVKFKKMENDQRILEEEIKVLKKKQKVLR